MGATLALLRHSSRRFAATVLVLGAILGGFQVLLALAGSALQETGMFGQIAAILPPFVREIVGPALATVMSYAGVAAIGYFHVAVTAAVLFLAIAIGAEPAAEIESGLADVVLSRPTHRSAPVARSAILLLGSLTLVIALMLAGTAAGASWIAPENAVRPKPFLILSLAVNLWALALAWGGIALAAASASRRRSACASAVGLVALALFLLDYLGRLWRPAAEVARLSPFRYFSGLDLVAGKPLPASHLAVLAGIAIAAAAVAFVIYARRDV